MLLPKGWVLLQHYLIAFLQSAQHFCFGAIGDTQVHGELLLPSLSLGLGISTEAFLSLS